MKILVTGAKGFVGKNLCAELKNLEHNVLEFDVDNSLDDLKMFTADCDFVFHLAGVNRPKEVSEFTEGNVNLTKELVKYLKENNNNCSVVLSSSIQAELENDYGKSKKEAEQIIFQDEIDRSCVNYVFRLPNLFGKWCRPNYNSVIATFCHNIANDLPITINNRETILTLCYIDDVVDAFINAIKGEVEKDKDFCTIPVTHKVSLGEIADLIQSFRESRNNYAFPNITSEFSKKLYSTYLSYLKEDNFAYNLKMNVDNRGSFTEILKGACGQVSVNIIKPNITKGNHWHHTKNEKFVVVSGKCSICFRKIDSTEVIEYIADGENIKVVDIPVGYTHNIKNIGENDAVVVMWANEPFDPNKPDTYFLPV